MTYTLTKWLAWIALAAVYLAAAEIANAEPRHGTASWYSVASCKREGTSGIMANGEPLDDQAFTAASWDYRFGTVLQVCYAGQCTQVTVTDRGPAKRLYRQGRIIDLSRAAFLALSPLSAGVIDVTVEPL